MSNDKEQKGINVPQHKRLAAGEKLDGTSYQPKGGGQSNSSKGGLSHLKKK